MKQKPKTMKKEETRIVYYLYCPLCKKEIKGNNPSQIEYALGLHLEKHKKEENEKN